MEKDWGTGNEAWRLIRESLCGGAGAISLGYDDLSQGKSEEYRGMRVSICQSVGALGFRLVWLISWAALAATYWQGIHCSSSR